MKRNTRRTRIVMFSATAVGVVVLMATTSARALAPDAHGWWWTAQQDALPAPLPTPPWVPADGLYVASNPQGAEAFAAVRFTLPEGATATSLQLTIDHLQGTPIVGVCPVRSPWEPAQGGSMSDAPEFDCELGAPGTIAEDGASISFAVGAVAREGTVDLALVPLADESGGNPTFQLALAKPDGTALTTSEGSASTATDSTFGDSSTDANGGSVSTPQRSPTAGPAFEAEPPPPADAPVATAGSQNPDAGSSANAGGQQAFVQPPPADNVGNRNGTRTTILAIIVLLDSVAVLLWFKRDSLPVRRLQARLAGTEGALPPHDARRVCGVGPFARVREGPTPRL